MAHVKEERTLKGVGFAHRKKGTKFPLIFEAFSWKPVEKVIRPRFGPFRPESSASKLGNQAGCLRFDADDLNENDSNLASKHFFNRLLVVSF